MPNWRAEEIKTRGLKLLKFFEKRWEIKFDSEEEMIDLLHLDFLNPKVELQEMT